MDRDVLDLHPDFRARLFVHLECLDVIKDLCTLQHLAKHRVLAVQMRGGGEGDEELAPVCVGAFVRHAHDAPCIVPQGGADLVLEQLVGGVVDGGRGFGLGIGGWAAGLHHEVRDQAVEGRAIVKAGGAEGEEVLSRLGNRLAEELELDVTSCGVQLRHGQRTGSGEVVGEGRGHSR